MRIGVLFLALLAAGSADAAPRVIACVSGDGPPVTLTIGAKPDLSRTVNCISARFVHETLACAPNGGFQFTYTGGSHLVAAVKEWAGSADRVAAVTSTAGSSVTARRSSRRACWRVPRAASTSARSRWARPLTWARSSERWSQGMGLSARPWKASIAPTSGK